MKYKSCLVMTEQYVLMVLLYNHLDWKERIRLNTLIMVLVEMDLYDGHSAVMCVSQTHMYHNITVCVEGVLPRGG